MPCMTEKLEIKHLSYVWLITCVITLLVIFPGPPARAGLFSKSPPSAWDQLLVVFRTSDGVQRSLSLKGTDPDKPTYFLFRDFIGQITKQGSLAWRDGSIPDKWMGDLESVDEETNKKRVSTFIFSKITADWGKDVVSLDRLYIDGKEMPNSLTSALFQRMAADHFGLAPGDKNKKP